MRFHVLGIPHTASNKDYVACAFTQKVIKLCSMLKSRGHTVFHYGNELSQVECDENVVITRAEDIGTPAQFLNYDLNDKVYHTFTGGAIVEIAKRKQPCDFLLCPWGAGHKLIADAHHDLIVVESGIGYAKGHFAKFKVFESYALLHAYYGLPAVETADKFNWYDVVIPNAFDPNDFIYREAKEDYLLFLGMRHNGIGKGLQIAIDAARDSGRKLLVAGPEMLRSQHSHVEYVGLLDVERRAKVLSMALAVLAPSIFLEPFCGVQVESFFSGTPVISSDWGAFAEYNLHGITGYRCRTHEQFVWAINHVNGLDPCACQQWAIENFSLDHIAKMYDEYFTSVMNVYTGNGWYEPNPDRLYLDWLYRRMPIRA